jgi:hypothetical protein
MTIGRKDDKGKARWDLVAWDAFDAAARVLSYGASKYGEYNWQHVPDAEDRYFSALLRHLVAWRRGDLEDADTGENPLAHVLCNAMFLLALSGDGKPRTRPISPQQSEDAWVMSLPADGTYSAVEANGALRELASRGLVAPHPDHGYRLTPAGQQRRKDLEGKAKCD